MAVSASASGTFERPVFEGRVSLDGLELVTSPGETPIEGITGSLQLTPGRITTDDLSLRWNGNVGVAGALTLDGLRMSGLRLNVHLDDVRSEPFPGLRTTVSGDLVLLGDDEVRSARGELTDDPRDLRPGSRPVDPGAPRRQARLGRSALRADPVRRRGARGADRHPARRLRGPQQRRADARRGRPDGPRDVRTAPPPRLDRGGRRGASGAAGSPVRGYEGEGRLRQPGQRTTPTSSSRPGRR